MSNDPAAQYRPLRGLTGLPLSSAITNANNVTKTGSSSAVVAQGGINVPDSLLAPLVLDSPDFFDTLRIKKWTRSQ
jgi:hypothetical protein